MRKRNVAVAIPLYKQSLNKYEFISLKQCFCILKDHPIILIVPEDLELTYYDSQFYGFKVERFPKSYFKNIDSYNRLMLSSEFYRRFSGFDKILIYQADAFVFSDRLDFFCSLDYDYIGAPWLDGEIINPRRVWSEGFNRRLPRRCYVGNGGLSLRTIEKTIFLLEKYDGLSSRWVYNEDAFFSILGAFEPEQFHLATVEAALEFSFEISPRRCYELNNNRLPFGCHAWWKYDIDFFRPFLEINGYHEIK